MTDLLAVQYDDKSEAVVLAGSPAALRALAHRLEALAARADSGVLDHEHLRSQAWAGNELASSLPEGASGRVVIHHVKIYGLNSRPHR